MARYIDADALIKKIFPYNVVDKKLYCINAQAVYDAILKAPTADVVPREEVEHWKEEANRYQKFWCQTYNDFETDEMISEAKAEVAREIFEEIERETKNHGIAYTQRKIAELKKKYTGERHGTTR